MAYIDLDKIVDRDAKDLITRDPDVTADALAVAEMETQLQANFCGVLVAKIPVHETTGCLTSPALYSYCKNNFLYELFLGVAGSIGEDDIYTQKVAIYDRKSKDDKNRITYQTIMNVEVTNTSSTVRNIPIVC